MPIVGAVMLVAGIALIVVGRYKRAILTAILETHSYSAHDLAQLCRDDFSALVEVQGVVKCAQPILSPISETECVWYHTDVRRRRGSGNRTWWERAYDDSLGVVFEVHDDTGVCYVDPDGARVDTLTAIDGFDAAVPKLGLGPGWGTLGYRVIEKILPLDFAVYVFGQADYDESLKGPILRFPGDRCLGPERKGFLISFRSQREIVQARETAIAWYWWLGMIFIIAGVAIAAVGLITSGLPSRGGVAP